MRDRFVVEYLKDFNATRAAIRAGYSPKTAASQGQRLLRSVVVIKAIGEDHTKLLKQTEASTERVLKELAAIAFPDPGQFFDEHGNLLPMDAVPAEARRALRSLKVQELFDPATGEQIGRLCKLVFRNKVAALKKLGQYLGMFTPISKVTGNGRPLMQAECGQLSPEAVALRSEQMTNGILAPSKPPSLGGTKRRGSHIRNRFAVEYLKDLNATQAAIRAGYSAKTAASQGQRLLKFPAVRDAIAHAQAKLLKKTEVSVENVKRELAAIAFSEICEFFEHGVLPINAAPEGARRALSRVKVKESFETDRGEKKRIGRPYKLILSDANPALDAVANHLGMYAPGERPRWK